MAVRTFAIQLFQLILKPHYRAPYLLIATERGQKLRFYRPHNLRLNDEAIREFLLVEGWKESPVWSTSFAPGGSR